MVRLMTVMRAREGRTSKIENFRDDRFGAVCTARRCQSDSTFLEFHHISIALEHASNGAPCRGTASHCISVRDTVSPGTTGAQRPLSRPLYVSTPTHRTRRTLHTLDSAARVDPRCTARRQQLAHTLPARSSRMARTSTRRMYPRSPMNMAAMPCLWIRCVADGLRLLLLC